MAVIYYIPPYPILHTNDSITLQINSSSPTEENVRFKVTIKMFSRFGPLDPISETTFWTFASYDDFFGNRIAIVDLSERLTKLYFENIDSVDLGTIAPPEATFPPIVKDFTNRGIYRKLDIIVQQYSGNPVVPFGPEVKLSDAPYGYYQPVVYGGSGYKRTFGWFGATYMQRFLAASSIDFLTHAPNGKYTFIGKPEFLTFLWKDTFPVSFHRQVTIKCTDGTTLTYDVLDVEVPDSPADYLFFGSDYTSLDIASYIPAGKKLWYYEVRIADDSNDPISPSRRYYIDYQPHEQIRTFIFLNSLGAWETVHFTGLARNKSEFTQKLNNIASQPEVSNYLGQRIVTDSSYQESQKVSMFLESREWAFYMKDFLLSKHKYELQGVYWVPIENVTNNYVIDDDKSGYQFDYEYRYRFTDNSFHP